MRKVWLFCAVLVGLLVIPAPVGAAGSRSTPVWIGAPHAGQYQRQAMPGHHQPSVGQWAMDFYAPGGTGVYVYAAPKDSSKSIRAYVTAISASSCGANKAGYNVKVEFRHSGTPVGYVLYSHVVNLRVGQGEINRWGTRIGDVGYWSSPSSCWQVRGPSGAHTHIEMANYLGSSCYRGLPAGSRIARGEFLGYIGRNDAGACAAGA
jgi:hypothetical protein